MDQTDFSMLVGWTVGMPLGTVALHQLLPLPWWGSGLLAIPCGFVPTVALAFIAVEWLGRRSERRASPPRPDAEPGAAPDDGVR